MDCECAFAEPVHVKSRAARPGAFPEYDNSTSGFRSAAGNLAVQRRARDASADVSSAAGLSAVVQHGLRGSGQPLDHPTRDFMESRFGQDFSHVRIHTGKDASESARALSATAYTVGHDIVFAQDQYAPHSLGGKHLLTHELTHVVQQGRADWRLQSGPLRVDVSGENRAESAAENVSAGRPAGGIHSVHALSVQRFLEELGDVGKVGELGKLGELGKSSPPEIAKPIPEVTPKPTPNVAPKPGLGPLPDPFPVGPMPQPKEGEDDKQKDPKCGTKELPLTRVTFFPGPLGQGGRVKASPLTKCPGNTQGSQPDPAIYKDQFDCINAAGQGGKWVRAHILHGETRSSGPFNLHGPGDDIRNLIITDKSINGLMSTRAERPVIKSIYEDNTAFWYDSKVDSYEPGKEYFAQSVTVAAGIYHTDTDSEGPAIDMLGGTFPLKAGNVPPNCPPPAGAGPPPPVPVLGITPPMPEAGTATTPISTLQFQSTLQICLKELSSRDFDVKNGGLEVRIFAEWSDKDGEKAHDSSACPIDHYFVLLEQHGNFFGYNQYSQKPIQIPVGKEIPPLKWTGLQDDNYRLKIYIEGDHPGCCLQGTITVSTFNAPAGSALEA